MKPVVLAISVALFAVSELNAQTPSPAKPSSGGTAVAGLTDLVSDSRWSWWEGNFDRYQKGKMQYWVAFYKDGTARVPWRDHPQYWTVTEPNVLTLTGAGLNPDKHVFLLNLTKKTGSRENQSLHIRYEKKATRPARFK